MKTLNQLIINTNGNLFFYKNFSSELHYKNIFTQIHKTLQNKVVFEGGLKIQFSHKFSVKDYVTPVLLYNKNMNCYKQHIYITATIYSCSALNPVLRFSYVFTLFQFGGFCASLWSLT